jgi:hypothetical protein
MKNNLRMMFIPAALVVIFGCAATCLAQKGVITGGYGSISTNDAQVKAAAKYAVKTQGKKQGGVIKLVAVKQAEVQVVAGQNYRLCMEVTIKSKGTKTAVTKNVVAVIYKNLKQKLSLTSWEEAVCLQLNLD